MRLSGEGDQTEIEILWETKRMIPQTASPVLYNGRLYVVVSNGSMVCFDAMSGRPRWRQRLKGSGGFHASLVAGDGKVYATSNSGLVTVIDVREGYNHLASNQMEGGVNASPVFAGRDLLIRTASSLYRIRGQNEAAVAAKVEP